VKANMRGLLFQKVIVINSLSASPIAPPPPTSPSPNFMPTIQIENMEVCMWIPVIPCLWFYKPAGTLR